MARQSPMSRRLVCTRFDFDAVSGFVARGMTSPPPVSCGEFGAVAIPRILRLLKSYRMPASFFVPGHPLPKRTAAKRP